MRLLLSWFFLFRAVRGTCFQAQNQFEVMSIYYCGCGWQVHIPIYESTSTCLRAVQDFQFGSVLMFEYVCRYPLLYIGKWCLLARVFLCTYRYAHYSPFMMLGLRYFVFFTSGLIDHLNLCSILLLSIYENT